jgi:hypothetical protein
MRTSLPQPSVCGGRFPGSRRNSWRIATRLWYRAAESLAKENGLPSADWTLAAWRAVAVIATRAIIVARGIPIAVSRLGTETATFGRSERLPSGAAATAASEPVEFLPEFGRLEKALRELACVAFLFRQRLHDLMEQFVRVALLQFGLLSLGETVERRSKRVGRQLLNGLGLPFGDEAAHQQAERRVLLVGRRLIALIQPAFQPAVGKQGQ